MRCDGGILKLYFKNENSGPVELQITTTSTLLNKATGKPIDAHISSELLDPTAETKLQNKTLAKGDSILVQLTITNIRETGEWTGKIYNRGTELETFELFRYQLPFNVRLDVEKPEQPELTFHRGEAVKLPLYNADNATYRVRLDFILKGTTKSPPDITLPPMGSAVADLPLDWNRLWFNNCFQGRFRDETVEGRIVLAEVQPQCLTGQCKSPASDDTGTKTIKVIVHLNYYRTQSQFVFVALLLLFGALCSLLLSTYLPNQMKRIKLKKQLDGLAGRIRNLPMKLASRVRVSLGLEARRCLELLNSTWVIQPGFGGVVDEVGQRLKKLDKRLELAEELGRLRLRFEALRDKSLFPTPMNLIEDEFEGVDDLLRKVDFLDADQSASQTFVDSISTRIDNLEDINKFYAHQHDQVEQISARAWQLLRTPPSSRDVLLGNGRAWPGEKKNKEGKLEGEALYGRMFDRLKELTTHKTAAEGAPAEKTAGAKETPQDQKDLFLRDDLLDADRLATKMLMLRDCARLDHAGPPQFDELADLLVSQNTEEFDAARRLEKQIKDNVYSPELVEEITTGATKRELRPQRDWGRYAGARRLQSFFHSLVWLLVPVLLFFGHWIWSLILLFALILWAVTDLDPVARLSRFWDSRWPPKTEEVWFCNPEKVRIDNSTNEVRTYEPVQLNLKLCKERLNSRAVREDITPFWDFDHDKLSPEEGWEVMHYFPRARKYIVRARFQLREGGFLRAVPADSKTPAHVTDPSLPLVYAELEITPQKAKGVGLWASVVDVVWLIVALVPVIAALYAGAIEQLNKVDFIPALIAIFGLGFTSDQVKSLIQKSQGDPTVTTDTKTS